jgi:hypothetical protein
MISEKYLKKCPMCEVELTVVYYTDQYTTISHGLISHFECKRCNLLDYGDHKKITFNGEKFKRELNFYSKSVKLVEHIPFKSGVNIKTIATINGSFDLPKNKNKLNELFDNFLLLK